MSERNGGSLSNPEVTRKDAPLLHPENAAQRRKWHDIYKETFMNPIWKIDTIADFDQALRVIQK